ncbi:MAG: CBS and ACT domain-containing protein [Desulfovibrio sp.]|nr:CBS and ACT domain-containing protein [Desulfovibrio sp.]
MLVQEWMTRDVIAVAPDTSIMKASRLMKDNSIRRLPVVDQEQHVIGIISDRDIKEASPSKATSLDVHEMYYLLSELKIHDIMTKHPICAKETDSMEAMAFIMAEQRFGGMPVVNAESKLVGIITESDIFKVLVAITGVRIGGIQLAFELPVTPHSLRPILDALKELGAGFVSILTSQESNDAPFRRVYIRLRALDKEKELAIVSEIKKNFPSLLYWEPGMNNT